jgi:hypothetical protein
MPSYFRPEYLYLALEHLSKAVGGPEKEVWIAQDKHPGDDIRFRREAAETLDVLAAFKSTFRDLRFSSRTPHSYVGNPFNFLELYKDAYRTDARFVYLVEDDVLVAPDFFQWHEAVHARRDYFVTVGWHCVRNEQVRTSSDPTEYIESAADYSSIGVCWKREALAPVVNHATHEYYRDMRQYLARHFPTNRIPPAQWTEQAGLVMRLILEGNGSRVVAWPSRRRCAHVGIQGYHRPGGYKFQGDLQQRIAGLRGVLAEPGKIFTLKQDNFGGDIEHPEVVPAWVPEDLKVVQTFSMSPANPR